VSATLTYVYCLVRSARRPSITGVPAGVPLSEAVRLVDVPPGKTWLVVSTVPQRAYAEEVLDQEMQRLEWIGERALAHEAVVEHFLRADAVLPMQLFTLFMTDERAVEHVTRDRRRIERILSKIAGQVEWGLRLTLDPEVPATPAKTPLRRARVASGADYLARKRDVRDAVRDRTKKARLNATRIYRALAAEATAAERRTDADRTVPGSRVVLDAAFLVPAGRAAAFRAVVRRQTGPLKRAGVAAVLTGPWPPYNFI
jgi:hypothetical protein